MISLDERQAEIARRNKILSIAVQAADRRPHDVRSIKALSEEALEAGWPAETFRFELMEDSVSTPTIHSRPDRSNRLTDKVLEAAICTAGRLPDVEKRFDDQTLQTAHDRFRNGIGLKQLFILAAQANGYNGDAGYDVDIHVQRAAFGLDGPQSIQASGFSSFSLPNVVSNTANKFLKAGWESVDQTPMRISGIRPVRDFKTTTTVSLTGDLMFEQVGPDGQIKHGKLGEEVYTNKADTYARILSITRTDIINDDLGALTTVPRRLGRGGMLKLNDIFWAKFLNNATFFTAARGNLIEGGVGVEGALTSAGLAEADKAFELQTDPDGNPLGEEAKILLVPTALKTTAAELMTSQKVVSGATTKTPDKNIWEGRYQYESSPYMSNAKYTGYSAAAWYLLADPNSMPVIEIVALNGRVEPTVETADADFNVLGVQMRGFNDVGVELQEYRGGVRADGVAVS